MDGPNAKMTKGHRAASVKFADPSLRAKRSNPLVDHNPMNGLLRRFAPRNDELRCFDLNTPRTRPCIKSDAT